MVTLFAADEEFDITAKTFVKQRQSVRGVEMRKPTRRGQGLPWKRTVEMPI
jgi:hypothetical protein